MECKTIKNPKPGDLYKVRSYYADDHTDVHPYDCSYPYYKPQIGSETTRFLDNLLVIYLSTEENDDEERVYHLIFSPKHGLVYIAEKYHYFIDHEVVKEDD